MCGTIGTPCWGATAGMVRLVQPVRVLALESLVRTVEVLFLLSSCSGTIDATFSDGCNKLLRDSLDSTEAINNDQL